MPHTRRSSGSTSVRRLDPNRDASDSPTKHFFNGLLRAYFGGRPVGPRPSERPRGQARDRRRSSGESRRGSATKPRGRAAGRSQERPPKWAPSRRQTPFTPVRRAPGLSEFLHRLRPWRTLQPAVLPPELRALQKSLGGGRSPLRRSVSPGGRCSNRPGGSRVCDRGGCGPAGLGRGCRSAMRNFGAPAV